jgi:hypothetical protein
MRARELDRYNEVSPSHIGVECSFKRTSGAPPTSALGHWQTFRAVNVSARLDSRLLFYVGFCGVFRCRQPLKRKSRLREFHVATTVFNLCMQGLRRPQALRCSQHSYVSRPHDE